ncbi:protein SFI1 homolog [Acropora millepora]|uniref:protein SFI1 homolog n=1 Tax=Acropora millepora TaxID=45264 RepID=UPI001CF54B9C|nr:protein SFI1 homolog [Acropora millepora]
MQEDSPGRQDKPTRNDRYSTPTKPKQLSVASAKHKAKEFAAKDDKATRVLAKQAILKELNSQLIVKAEAIAPKNRKAGEQGGNEAEYSKSNKKKRVEEKPIFKQASKIPRVHGAIMGQSSRRKNTPLPIEEGKDCSSKTALADNNGEFFKVDMERYQYLLGKYVLIWEKKTFGRVTPGVARSHYERKLKDHALQVWQEIWWSGRKGWKLNVRADYHNRYRSWQKAWRAWREYMRYSKSKKAKDKLAVDKANQSVLRKCWSGWREYIRTRRHKQRLTDGAMEFSQILLKRRAWGMWLARLTFIRNLSLMDREAMAFWANNLMGKVWSVWIAKLIFKTKEKEKISLASRFYDQTLVLKAWRGMKNLRSISKLKQLRYDAAHRHHSVALLQKAFTLWVARWQRQTELSQFEDLISFKGNVAVARRAFIMWKNYIALQHEKYNKEELASQHYRQHLMKTCFNSLRLQAVNRRLKEMRLKLASDLSRRLRLLRVWVVWLRRCEHSEELKLLSLSRKARAHFSFLLRKKLFSVWMKYCQWRRFRKSKYAIADFHFRQRALPRYFFRLLLFMDQAYSNKERNSTAENFRREALQAKMFYTWWKKYQMIMDIRMMERMAILHNDEVVKRRYLRFWCRKTLEKQHERELESVAEGHYNRRILLMGISRWREFNAEVKGSRWVQQSSLRHYYIHLLKKTWAAWKQYVNQRQEKWQKQVRANLHYQHRLLSAVICGWKLYKNNLKAVKAHCDEKFQSHYLNLLRFVFDVWKQNARESKEKRQKKLIAETHLKQTLLSKCFAIWRVFATEHAVKHWKQWNQVQEIQETLQKGKLLRSFRAWKSFTRKSVYYKNLEDMADDHHGRILLFKSLLRWKSYIHLCFRIKILQRQSMWLHNRRITAAFFSQWKKRHSLAVQEKRHTVLALWYWSVNLQRKAFYGILEYAISRKRKALRISTALEERRNRLLREAVTRWMKAGFHLAAERSRFAQERQLEAAQSVHHCVHRCAMHWRRITAKRVRQRGGKPRPRPSIESTSERPITSVSRNMNPVPSVQPAAYSVVDRIISEAFKERPPPRKPDYLSESFDLSKIATNSHQTPSVLNTLTSTVEDNEGKPRLSHPLPSDRLERNVHPNQRNLREGSFVFPSSSGEESSVAAEGTRGTQLDKRELIKPPSMMEEKECGSPGLSPKLVKTATSQSVLGSTKQRRGIDRKPVLLPPSSFMLPPRSKRFQPHESSPEGIVLRDSNSTHPASTPRTSLDRQQFTTSSPEDSTSSRGLREDERYSSDEEEWSGDTTGELKESDYDQLEGEMGNEQIKPKTTEGSDVRQELLVPRMGERNLHRQIAAMKNTLQEFQDLKRTYYHKKKQRDQLFAWIQEQIEELGPRHEDGELLQPQECMSELTEEVSKMEQRIAQARPLVEEIEAKIRELIHRSGILQQSPT